MDGGNMRRKRAIVFDDDEMVLDFLTDLLSIRNFDVLAFREPVVCPVYGEDNHSCDKPNLCADIMITDIRMPAMKGIDLIKKQIARGCKLDIRNKAVISGHFDDNDSKMVKELGCSFIEKPFRPSVLLAWVEACEARINLDQPLGIMRRETRRPVNINVSYFLPASDSVHRGIITNISSCGACIETSQPITKDETLDLITDLPNLCTKAMVRWVNVNGGTSVTAGLHCC
jgi:DNA-binding response OmpR family regulator